MAQKFGNARWVKEGYLDNRRSGSVIGQIVFAGVGTVDVFLAGNFSGEIAGTIIGFKNPAYIDDPRAGESLDDFAVPQIGKVSLISFDPHPLLDPHPYIEWFSLTQQHYRIELEPADAWMMTEVQQEAVNAISQRIHQELGPLL